MGDINRVVRMKKGFDFRYQMGMNLKGSTHRAMEAQAMSPSVTYGTDNLWAALVRRESRAGPAPVGTRGNHPALLPPSPLDVPKGGNVLQQWQCLLCEVRKDKIKDI